MVGNFLVEEQKYPCCPVSGNEGIGVVAGDAGDAGGAVGAVAVGSEQEQQVVARRDR